MDKGKGGPLVLMNRRSRIAFLFFVFFPACYGCGAVSPPAGEAITRPADRRQRACSAPESPAPPRAQWPSPVQGDLQGTLGRIEIEGNRGVEEESIRAQIHASPGQPVDPALIQEDLQRIWALDLFEDISVELKQEGQDLVLTYRVIEKPVLDKVFYSGVDKQDIVEVDGELDMRGGQFFSAAKFHKRAKRVVDRYREKGHRAAKLDYRLNKRPNKRVDLCIRVKKGPVFRIERIQFRGNRKVASADLLAVMGLKERRGKTPGSMFDRQVLQMDMLRISSLYYEQGMINARVGVPVEEETGEPGALVLTIPVEEGDVFHLGEISFSGVLVTSENEKKYRALLQTKPGQIFVRSRLQADMQRINDLHRKQGRGDLFVSPLTSIDTERLVIDINFHIEQGPM
jgi:outer membrane protein insertion porin family